MELQALARTNTAFLNELQLGEDWIQMVMEGASEPFSSICHREVASHLLTPKHYMNFSSIGELQTKVHQWFGECSHFQLLYKSVEMVGERVAISYRFQLQKNNSGFTIEQQLYCTVTADKFSEIHLLCSGFQPILERKEV